MDTVGKEQLKIPIQVHVWQQWDEKVNPRQKDSIASTLYDASVFKFPMDSGMDPLYSL